MLDKVLANAAEQIAVSPDQSQYTIQNQDVLPGNTVEQQSILQPTVTTTAINNQLSDNQEWKEYLSNPFRRSDRKTMPFWALEDMMADPVYYATTNKYGNELRQQGEIMYGAYRKADSWTGRLADAYNVARYNLRAAAARTDLSRALESGDEEAIAKAQQIYDQEQRNIRTQGLKYDSDFWNSMMDISASMARNPEVFAIGIGAGVLTGGAATPAAVTAIQLGAAASEAAVVFADTYRIETGGVLQQLDVEHPELSEKEKYDLASQAGLINATIEAVPMLIGAGLTARSAATLREATKQVVLKSKLPTKLATSAVFLKALGDELQKKTVGGIFLNRLADGALEGVQEVIQDAVQKAAIRAVQEGDRSIAGLTLEDLNEFMSAENPLDPKYADKIDTFVNVGLGSFLLGAPFAVVDATSTRRPQNVREKLNGVQQNLSFLNGLRRWSQGSEVAKSSPETITKKLQNEIKLGTIDGKIYLDKKQVLKLMESDPDVAKALRNLGIEEALKESEENGGVVGVDFLKYEEQVIRGADDTLFQKIRDITSASPTNLSQAAFIEQLSTDRAAVEEIKRAREQPDSVYNQTYNQLIAMPGWDEKSAEAYASMMQLALNRIGAFRLVSSTGEQVFQNVEIRQGYSGEQPATIPPTEQPTTTTPATPAAPAQMYVPSRDDISVTSERVNAQGEPDPNGTMIKITTVPTMEDETVRKVGTHTLWVRDNGDGTYNLYESGGNAYYNKGFGWQDRKGADLLFSKPGVLQDYSEQQKLTAEEVEQGLNEYGVRSNTGTAEAATTAPTEESVGTETTTEGKETTEPETTTEEAATEQIITSASGTVGMPEDIIFDIKDRDSNYENNFKKDGEIKETVRKKINERLPNRVIKVASSFLNDLYSLIGHKNAKWVVGDVKSSEIVEFANKYDVSPNLIYSVVNIARGKPEARTKVVMPSKTLKAGEREKIITYFLEKSGGSVFEPLKKLSDYELRLLYELDPDYVSSFTGERLVARFSGFGSEYVDKDSLEKRYITRFGNMAFTFSRSTVGTWHLWGNLDGSKKMVAVMDFGSIDEMDEYRDNHTIEEVSDQVIATLTGRAEARLKELNEGIRRKGKDYREGRDVTADEVKQRFGFRRIAVVGITAEQEQKFLNSLYDSFSALADTIGVPYSAMSLSGTLSISTNMGRHVSSSAWYEPGAHNIDFVVNKDKISRAVAHEWWHAFDNYIAGGSKESLGYNPSYVSSKSTWWGADIRSEIRTDVSWLMNLRSTAPGFVKRTANAPHNSKYWSEATERAARMFEQYIADKLASKDEYDNLLTNTPDTYSSDGMYLTNEEKTKVFPYFDALFKDLKTEQTPSGQTRLFQKVGKEEKESGWFRMEGDKLIIGITPNANPTTLAHEIFHMFSVSMQQAFNSGEMTEYWKKQVNNLAKMVGAEIVDDKLKLTDAQEEKAANMFLQYIKEGKIQNREVAPLFAYMQQAFARICRALGLTGKLSKESMELFDSLFRAHNDIEEEQKLAGLIAFEKPEGADQELYDFYVGAMLSSRAKASQNLVRKWYAIERFKQTEKYKAKRRDVFAAIYKQAQESMVYDVLRTIEDFGGDPAAALGILTERYPDANLTLDFLENLKATTPTLEQEVNRLTEEKMEEYVRDEFKITDEELALRMSRNRDKVKALIAEGVLRSGGGMAEFEATYKKANDAAERQMSKTSIKRLLDKNYWNTLEARIVERYAYALANKDTNGIMEERYNQAVVNLIKIRAVGYESRVQKLVAFATKLRTNQKKDEYTAEAWDLLQSIVEKFGFKVTATRRSAAPLAEKLRNWIENQERTTYTPLSQLMNFLPILQKGFDGTIMGMEVKTFDQLEAVLDAIDSVANKEYFLIGEGEKIFLGTMADETSKHFEDKGMKPFDGELTSSFFHKISRWRNSEPMLRALFPQSVMLKVWLPLINAKALSGNKEKQWIDRYRKVRAKISLSQEKHTYSNGVQMSNAAAADLFLAMGTQHAFENFCMKNGISAEQAEQVVSEALTATPELEEFVKEVWAIYAKSTDLLNDEYQKRNNKIFVKKEPRAFMINGIQFEGGYVPEVKLISQLERMPWEPQSANKEMGDIKNEKEITKQADGGVRSIVDNMERTLMLFARQAYLPLAYNNAAKFMNNTNVRDTIGTKAAAFIDDWMMTGFKSTPADTTGVARPIMSATTMAALGGRFMQGLVQLSGIVPAIIHIGPSAFLGAARKCLANPKRFIKAVETASGKSEYMRSRYEDPVSTLFGTSLSEQVSLEGGRVKWAVKGAQKLLMAYITYFDAIVSNITWDAAYTNAIDSGLSEEEATLEADSAVRITQTDSMQATRATALNSPLARALTPFSSYIMGMQSQAFALWTGNDKVRAVEFALGYIVISTLVESLAKEAGEGGDDDDEEFVERALHRWYNEVIGTVGSSAVPFANLGGVVSKKVAAGIEKGATGGNAIFEKYGLSVPMIQYLDRFPTIAYNLAAGVTSGDDEYFVKSMTSASGLVSRGFEKRLKEMLDD